MYEREGLCWKESVRRSVLIFVEWEWEENARRECDELGGIRGYGLGMRRVFSYFILIFATNSGRGQDLV